MEMSMLSTGSLWPYRDRKNFRLSMKMHLHNVNAAISTLSLDSLSSLWF